MKEQQQGVTKIQLKADYFQRCLEKDSDGDWMLIGVDGSRTRYLDCFEKDFVDSALAAALEKGNAP